MRKLLLMAIVFWLSATQALAFEMAQKHIPNAKQVGEARMTYLLWDVYDVTLHAPKGQWSADKPFALTLHYLRALDGEAIAERSAAEMRKQGFTNEIKLAAWYSQMRDIFPDVKKDTKLVGLYTPNAPTRFYKDGKAIGMIKDPEFGHWFFDFWLSDKTSEPQLRRQLLGLR